MSSHRDSSPASPLSGIGRSWTAACLLAVAAALALLALQPPVNADVTWHLVVGRVAEAGGALYVDIRDPNLPPILWLAQAAARLEGLTGWPAHRWYFLAEALWLAGALAASRPLLRTAAPTLSNALRWLLLAGLAWILAGVPGLHAGQRDHFATIGLLPYLIAAASPERAPLAWLKLAVAAGLAAAILLKPYYAVVVLAVELWRAAHRGLSWREVLRSEALMALPLVALALGVCLLLEPAWLDYVGRFGLLYAALPPLPFGWDAMALIALLPFAAMLSLLLGTPLPAGLLIGGCGALAVTALQNKWWDYHLLAPTLLLMAGLLAAALAAFPPRRLPAVALTMMAIAVVGWGALSAWRNLSLYHLNRPEPDFQVTLEGWIAEAGGRDARVAILSGHVVDFMPAVYGAGGQWALPDPSLWQLAAYPRLEPPEPERQEAFIGELLARLADAPPDILGLQETDAEGNSTAAFMQRPAFQALLELYEPLGELRRTRYWRRIGE